MLIKSKKYGFGVSLLLSAVFLLSAPCSNAQYRYRDDLRYDTNYVSSSRYYDQRYRYYQKNYHPYYRSRMVSYKRTRHSKREFYRVPLPSKISSGNIVKVDLANLSWGAYDDSGNLLRSGRVSGGRAYCPDVGRRCKTVTGTFTIYNKRGPECKSTRFPVGRGGAPMPYCMFFHGGYALHGSNAVPDYNASHGCVRMPPEDAQWLNQNFVRVGSTRVSIHY